MPEFNSDFFKEKFPHLYEMMEKSENKINVDGVRTKSDEDEDTVEQSEKGSRLPTVIDYIRLCDDEEDAFEIIDFMEDEEKISSDYAEDLRSQVRERGLDSFGSKRDPGEYSFIDEDEEE